MLTVQQSLERISVYRPSQTTPVLTQNAAADQRPYIHPILAPDGVGELTEDGPEHHPWQHGLYVGLNDVNGIGFWNEGRTGDTLSDGTFHPRPLGAPAVSGNAATWEVITDWKAPDGTLLLVETQALRLADVGDTFVLDCDWRLRAAVALKFGACAYGGLFLRMPWRAETGGDVRTSEGANTREAAEGQRARWVALAMPIPGRASDPAGIAFFDHPDNPGYPNPWRVDGNLGIVPSRCILGEWTLPENTVSSNRYRLLAFTGPIDPARIEKEWTHFAAT